MSDPKTSSILVEDDRLRGDAPHFIAQGLVLDDLRNLTDPQVSREPEDHPGKPAMPEDPTIEAPHAIKASEDPGLKAAVAKFLESEAAAVGVSMAVLMGESPEGDR